MNRQDQMLTDSVSRLLVRFSLPAIVALVVNALYNIVDSIFVGQGVGDLGLAGVTVCFPLVTVFIAFIMLIGMGATALVSIRLGEQQREAAETIVGNALVYFLILGLGLMVLGQLFLEDLLVLFGATPTVLPYAMDYMRIMLWGSVFLAVGSGMNNFIRAEGNPRTAMVTMLIGAATNIVLDYVFIFIFHWGIQGAAAATVLSYAVTSSWVLIYFFSGKSRISIKAKNLKLSAAVSGQIIKQGTPTFIVQITGSIQQLILNRKLAYHGGDLALAVIGVIMSITTFLVMPAMGIAQGAQPILGYNRGAQQYKRVKDTLLSAMIAATAIITIGFLVAKTWPAQLISLFNNNPDLLEMGTKSMAVYFKVMPLVGVQMLGASYFQAVGKAWQATLLALSRQVLIFIPLLLVLPYFWGLDGVWWSAPFSDLGAFLLTGTWLLLEIEQLKKQAQNTRRYSRA